MKKYLFQCLAICLSVFSACIDDKGNYEYLPAEGLQVAVTGGVEEEYTRDALQELEITPVFDKEFPEENYNYYWYVYISGNPSQVDTLSRKRNLDYRVMLESGQYHLVYQIENKLTGISCFKRVTLNVASIYNDVWMVAKDDGNRTDLDVVPAQGEVMENVLALVNRGDNLSGTAIKSGFARNYQHMFTHEDGTTESKGNINGLVMMSSNEVKIYNMDNMELLKNYQDCFFGPLPAGKPTWCCASVSGYTLVIGGRIYSFNGSVGATGKFAEKAGFYECGREVFSPIFRCNTFVFFDKTSQSLMRLGIYDQQVSLCAERADVVRPCIDMRGEMKYMEEQFVFPDRLDGLALFYDENGKYYSVELTGAEVNTGINPFKSFREIPGNAQVGNARVYAANQHVSTLYFVHPQAENELWSYDFTTQREKKQVGLAANEKIVYAKHVVTLMETVDEERVYKNVMALLTSSGGKWKLYILHFVGETQDIDTRSMPVNPPSGNGNASYVIYKGTNSMSM